jgi:hypothetical protein
MVADDEECTRLVPYWQYQFLPESAARDFGDATLQAFLVIASYASSIFSEQVPAGSLEEAHSLLRRPAPDDGDHSLAEGGAGAEARARRGGS